jgi:hypothetical protein
MMLKYSKYAIRMRKPCKRLAKLSEQNQKFAEYHKQGIANGSAFNYLSENLMYVKNYIRHAVVWIIFLHSFYPAFQIGH